MSFGEETYDTLRKMRRVSKGNSSDRQKREEVKEKGLKTRTSQEEGDESLYHRLHLPMSASHKEKIRKATVSSNSSSKSGNRRKDVVVSRGKEITSSNGKHHGKDLGKMSVVRQEKMIPQERSGFKQRKHYKLPEPNRNPYHGSRGIDGLIETSEMSLRQPGHSSSSSSQKSYKESKQWLRMLDQSTVHSPGNKVSKYRDPNKIARTLAEFGLSDESAIFRKIIKDRFQLEEDFIRINNKNNIDTVEGDYDDKAFSRHSCVGGLKVHGVEKGYLMVDEYDPKILKKNSKAFKENEEKAILISRKLLNDLV